MRDSCGWIFEPRFQASERELPGWAYGGRLPHPFGEVALPVSRDFHDELAPVLRGWLGRGGCGLLRLGAKGWVEGVFDFEALFSEDDVGFAFAKFIDGLAGDESGPDVLDAAGFGFVDGGIEGAEGLLEAGVIERISGEAFDESFRGFGLIGEAAGNEAGSLEGAGLFFVLGLVVWDLVIGVDSGLADFRGAVRKKLDEGVIASPVEDQDVVRHVGGDAAQDPHGFGGVAGDLKDIAENQRDAEAVACLFAASEGERDGEAVFIDTVDQAPEAIAHADDPGSEPLGVEDDAFGEVGAVVVVSDQEWFVLNPDGLGTAEDIGGRAKEGEHLSGLGIAAGDPGEIFPEGEEFRHVLLEGFPGLGEAGTAVRTGQVPGTIGGPEFAEELAPAGVRRIDPEGAEAHFVWHVG